MFGRGKYSGNTIGTPEFDERVLREADKRMRRLERRSLVAYARHAREFDANGQPLKSCHLEPVAASIRPGLLICTGCGEEFNRNNVKWLGDAALVVALTVYEMDDGNPAEAGRILAEAMHEHLAMEKWSNEE